MDTRTHTPRTIRDTRLIYPEEIEGWVMPDCQKDLRPNNKVRAYAESLKGEWGGVMKGTITLGHIIDDPRNVTYVVDGQHRLHAFKLTGLDECLADIDERWFVTDAELSAAYKQLNSTLVRQTPDDNLKSMQAWIPALRVIRTSCPSVGYGNVRRPGGKHMLSMSVLLRCWAMSRPDVPTNAPGNAEDLATALTDQDVRTVIRFVNLASKAWGTDREYHRLWGQANLALCMWLYRRLVLDTTRGVKRRVLLTDGDFGRCLMRLTSTHEYVDFLAGKQLRQGDRAPIYYRLCDAFEVSLRDQGMKSPKLPRPEWAPGRRKS